MRTLIDFLYRERSKPDYVIAEDFFPTPEEWCKLWPKRSELLIMSKKRAGKEIAPLTYARLAVMPDTKLWPFIQIASEISSVIKIFLQNVPKNKLGKQWQTIKEA